MSSTTEPPKDGAEVDFASLKVGQTIGRYEILSILGQGDRKSTRLNSSHT